MEECSRMSSVDQKYMFDEELKDLEIEYKKRSVDTSHKIDMFLPSMIFYMSRFVELYNEKEDARVKLEALKEKMNIFNGDE